MSENVRNFTVGITSIIALIGLAYLLFRFGELDDIIHPRYQIHLNTDNAAGLRPGSSVEFDGVPVGVVNSIYVQQNPTWPVRAELLIDPDARIPSNAVPYAESPLIGGGARLELRTPPAAEGVASAYLSDKGDAEISGKVAGGSMLDQITAALDERMKPLLAG